MYHIYTLGIYDEIQDEIKASADIWLKSKKKACHRIIKRTHFDKIALPKLYQQIYNRYKVATNFNLFYVSH